MENKLKWNAFFSQTGSEIKEIIKTTGFYPTRVITDNPEYVNDPYWEELTLKHKVPVTFVGLKGEQPTWKFDDISYESFIDEDCDLVTLHGWLNIIPPRTCEKYDIYNGHPGLITDYPELKGKDPQVRAFINRGDYDYIGSVIHKVTPKIDDGEVLLVCSVPNNELEADLDDFYTTLRACSLRTWIAFFDNHGKFKRTPIYLDLV